MNERDVEKNWYFARVAFWGEEFEKPEGEPGFLIMKYLLIEAENAVVAYRNVGIMLESLARMYSSGSWKSHRAEQNVERNVRIRPIGIYNFEPLLERIATGVEVFEEMIFNVSLEEAMADIIEAKEIEMIVEHEKNVGSYVPIERNWPDFFDESVESRQEGGQAVANDG